MPSASSKTLISVVGPTAVGKTAISVKLAKSLKTEIISADSRQFYKELNIGTAKPDKDEMWGVKHHFINSHSIEDEVNVGRYEDEAMGCIEALFKSYDILILVGGSGLFCKAIWEGLDPMPVIVKGARDEVKKDLEEKGLEVLLQELEATDEEYFKIVDRKNPQRVSRAIEVIRSTGKPFSSFRINKSKERPFNQIKIGLELNRDELYDRIDKRMDQMIEKGLFAEAESLYPRRNLNALQTVGYSEIFDFMDGIYDKEEAIRLLKRNSRRYAKRQFTWFKRDPEIQWFLPSDFEKIKDFVSEKLDTQDTN